MGLFRLDISKIKRKSFRGRDFNDGLEEYVW